MAGSLLFVLAIWFVVVLAGPPLFPEASDSLLPPDSTLVLVAEKTNTQLIYSLPQPQMDDMFNNGLRIAVVEAYVSGVGYSVVGIYQRLTQGYYPFYANFLQQMTDYDNGVIGTDFEIYSTWGDFYNDTNAWSACNFSYTGTGFPSGCGKVNAADPTATNSYVQFTDNAPGNGKGYTDVRVSVFSGGNCAATEERFVLYSYENTPQRDALDSLIALNPDILFKDIPFMTCSDCNAGRALIINTRNNHQNGFTLTCPEYLIDCTYTCPFKADQYDTSSVEGQADYLSQYLSDDFFTHYFESQGVSFVPVYGKKREVLQGKIKDFSFNVTNCTNLPNVVAFINNFIQKSMPGSTLRLRVEGCSVVKDIEQPPQFLYLIILVILVPVVLLALVAVKLYYGYYWLASLPHGVSWSYHGHNFDFGIGWDTCGSSDSYYYCKNYKKGSNDYKKAMELFNGFLGGSSLAVTQVKAIFNPVLLRQFINSWEITTERLTNSKEVFGRTTYDSDEGQVWIMEQYRKRVHALPWNEDLTCPILPTAHGTELYLAEKISQTGFANLSKLDAGYFGSGIYFSTFVLYTLPYFSSKKSPAVILSYVIPGNVYPVKEHHKSSQSLLGKPLISGYNSHYVVTSKSGVCVMKPKEGSVYDEIVIPLESQIVPAFIFQIDRSNFGDLNSEWEREVEADSLIRGRVGRDADGRGLDGRGIDGNGAGRTLDAGDRGDLLQMAQEI